MDGRCGLSVYVNSRHVEFILLVWVKWKWSKCGFTLWARFETGRAGGRLCDDGAAVEVSSGAFLWFLFVLSFGVV